MSEFLKGIIFMAVLVYVINPIDVPGPMDDLIVCLLGLAASKGISTVGGND